MKARTEFNIAAAAFVAASMVSGCGASDVNGVDSTGIRTINVGVEQRVVEINCMGIAPTGGVEDSIRGGMFIGRLLPHQSRLTIDDNTFVVKPGGVDTSGVNYVRPYSQTAPFHFVQGKDGSVTAVELTSGSYGVDFRITPCAEKIDFGKTVLQDKTGQQVPAGKSEANNAKQTEKQPETVPGGDCPAGQVVPRGTAYWVLGNRLYQTSYGRRGLGSDDKLSGTERSDYCELQTRKNGARAFVKKP